MMIITDDGQFAHNILAPKKHISKTYEVTIDVTVTEEMKIGFEKGVNLNDGVCKTAKLEITGENTAIVILTEGRYHQIKRMFGCFGAEVVELNRISMGNFYLPDDLELGEFREFTEEELKKRQEILDSYDEERRKSCHHGSLTPIDLRRVGACVLFGLPEPSSRRLECPLGHHRLADSRRPLLTQPQGRLKAVPVNAPMTINL